MDNEIHTGFLTISLQAWCWHCSDLQDPPGVLHDLTRYWPCSTCSYSLVGPSVRTGLCCATRGATWKFTDGKFPAWRRCAGPRESINAALPHLLDILQPSAIASPLSLEFLSFSQSRSDLIELRQLTRKHNDLCLSFASTAWLRGTSETSSRSVLRW